MSLRQAANFKSISKLKKKKHQEHLNKCLKLEQMEGETLCLEQAGSKIENAKQPQVS